MLIEHDVALAPLTTLGIGGRATRVVTVATMDELRETVGSDAQLLVLGGGSNVVIGDAGFAGTVIRLGMHEERRLSHDDDHAVILASAGTSWDDFVARACADGLAGIECLSGIPGLVGATPMQNVGAYGQEVADTIAFVVAYDRVADAAVSLHPRDCGFGYRTSRFRGSDRWIICQVAFRLARRATSMPIAYPELSRALGIGERESAPLARVRDTVIALRRGKGMVVDPADPESRSAGSFFTNPIVDAAALDALDARLPPDAKMPRFPQPDGRIKLAAGWLIERAGFAKGYTVGRVGISAKHALALVNRGGATATELLALAREIQDGVRDRLGVELVPEPVLV